MSPSNAEFSLHPRLAKDCHVLGQLPGAHLLLHREAALHWFILVPETTAMDLLDLAAGTREALLDQARCLHTYLREELDYPRVNVGALGLLVPQLHLHVIGRREGDPCWPAPVWGNLTSAAVYSRERVEEIRGAMAERLPGFAPYP